MVAQEDSSAIEPEEAHSALRLMRGTGRESWLTAEGTSMEPLIRKGDRIRFRMDPPAGIEPGGLIVFIRDGALICHRLLEWREESGSRFALQAGDAISEPSAVPEQDVVGVALELRTRGRSIRLDSAFAVLINKLIAAKRVKTQGGPTGSTRKRFRRLWVFLADRVILLCGRKIHG